MKLKTQIKVAIMEIEIGIHHLADCIEVDKEAKDLIQAFAKLQHDLRHIGQL
jgi:cell fate (sporulation/competence/biofilm development) regulator YlbF (YheA/YmcA/DUF963 family)